MNTPIYDTNPNEKGDYYNEKFDNIKRRVVEQNVDDLHDYYCYKPKIPYKSIILATILFVTGTLLLIISMLIICEYAEAKYDDRLWPTFILGLLMFIPGCYHVRLAVYAYKGYKGYDFVDIPEFD